MAIKTHKVTLSLDNPRVIQSGINVQSFDKQSIQISIELTKNDEVFQVPSDATVRVSLLKLARQEQKIIVDVPNTNRESIDWIVPDYLDGYQGTVRVGVYLVSGAENVDLGYFTILSNVSDIDKMADEFVDNVFQGWEQIEADLNELNLTIAQANLDLADDLTQIDNTIANINTLASEFTTDVATKQADVTSKYNAFDTSVTTANQTIDDILGLADDVQQVSTQVAEKVQNFKIKNEVVNGGFSDGLLDWNVVGISAGVSEGQLRINITTPNICSVRKPNLLKLGSKYYYKYDSRVQSGSTIDGADIGGIIIPITVSGSMVNRSGVITAVSTNATFGVRNNNAVTDRYYDNILIIDLTSIFGAGNEPTKEDMDRLVAMVPNQRWDGELDLTQQQYVNWLLSFIREKTNKTQEAWIVPTLLNGWIGAAGSSNIKYRKNNFGIVEIEGVLSGGTLNTIAFVLPVGYRPVNKYYIAIPNGYIEVNVAGNIIPKSGTLHNLSTISFEGV